MNSRHIAAKALYKVLKDNVSLTLALDELLGGESKKDSAFIQALCFGVMRWYFYLEALLGVLTRKPIKDLDIKILALIGLYQIKFMRVKPHAAVSETVSAVRKKSWARPLLNALLRRYLREQEALDQQINTLDLPIREAHPVWMVEMLVEQWPDQAHAILKANNQQPPMTIRVNPKYYTQTQYQAVLASQAINATMVSHCSSALVLEKPIAVERLPGFSEGHSFVQDSAAQLAVTVLDLQPGQRVLDVCAAPGGKTTHILETEPALAAVVALDIDANRLSRVKENLERLALDAELVRGDASRPEDWWDGVLFDRILLDAPCSATGVVRRHPDIKWLRQPKDIAAIVELQQKIMCAIWALLKPGGRLVYATCSVLQQENEEQVVQFLASQEDADSVAITAAWGQARRCGRQILTGDDGMDGFFYAVIVKQ
ncbi:MAG: 16S rRNA (cytosine(967)-C(5))-methyltransferase RsmB [Methylococcales bacterium]|nr:16S rRNA (cytosine(967)-C(5))-methyltransferase RsmB [Methylococcales bacterium]